MNMTFNFYVAEDAAHPAGTPAADAGPSVQSPERPRLCALLVGQPNVGKSVVFGALTGTYVAVSNYPGTTVEITRGSARFGDKAWQIVDTPGTQNLVPMSDDEAVSRDMLVSGQFDALVQGGDAKNLARTLLFTVQLAELGVPFCLDLNMADEARAGERVMVGVVEGSPARVDRLASLGILPGVELRLQQTRPVVVVECEETVLALERDVASDIVVVACGQQGVERSGVG